MNEPIQIPSIEDFNQQEALLEGALKSTITKHPADTLFLSGGIDSSLLAALEPTTPALTVSIQGKGRDIRYAQQTAAFLGLDWQHIELSTKNALDMLPAIIRHLNSYDLGILNDIVMYAGMRYAKSLGSQILRTGDGGDDLFGGYSFSWSKDGKLLDPEFHKDHLNKLYPHMQFPSDTMAESFGMVAYHPYVAPEVAAIALPMNLSYKVQPLQDMDEPGDAHYQLGDKDNREKQHIWSKIILRRLAKKYLPIDIIRRPRTDLEYGSGAYTLEELLAQQISQVEIDKLEQRGIKFWNNPLNPNTKKAHAYLRLLFEQNDLEVPLVRENEYACGWCEGGVAIGRSHCSTCGAWPANEQG